ncbi:hypothetical protein SISNIDRAFT_454093, partial [Sistotremastrum niveocremeum HHB9708]
MGRRTGLDLESSRLKTTFGMKVKIQDHLIICLPLRSSTSPSRALNSFLNSRLFSPSSRCLASVSVQMGAYALGVLALLRPEGLPRRVLTL